MKTTLYLQFGKRLLDLAIAMPLLLMLSPLLLLLACAVRATLGGPVLFVQQRPGLRGKLFRIYKFRTMRDAFDANGQPLPDECRLTRFGQFLRASSLDELPELWNVVRGDMSLVGPRPLLPEYLNRYSSYQARRHEVRPGLTGWAQINGRNDISWEVKFDHDVWYVDHCSLLLDLAIMARTVSRVIGRKGVQKSGYATTEKFGGVSDMSWQENGDADTEGAIVLGAGGHAKVVISTLRAAGWHVEAAYDDDPAMLGQRVLGVEVRGTLACLESHPTKRAVIAVGDPARRSAIADKFCFQWLTVVHPTAWVDPSCTLGAGTVVLAGAIVQAGSRVGSHSIMNTCASVDHDCTIGDFVHVAPGARLAGGVSVGDRTLVGMAAAVLPGMTIGNDSIAGAGAVVVDQVPAGVVVVGCPARSIKRTTSMLKSA